MTYLKSCFTEDYDKRNVHYGLTKTDKRCNEIKVLLKNRETTKKNDYFVTSAKSCATNSEPGLPFLRGCICCDPSAEKKKTIHDKVKRGSFKNNSDSLIKEEDTH